MIVLDTNVLSEFLRPAPAPQVQAWLDRQDSASIFFTAVGEAELRYGVAILPIGKKRTTLETAINAIMDEDFRDRILAFDREAARAYPAIAAERRTAGHPISHFDCQIAAITRAHGAKLATRNTKDFEGCGLIVVDPWR